MKVATVDEMRSLDQRAITEYGIPEPILMENAGEAVYYVILRDYGVPRRRFAVICGLGNNGGDGLVVARKLHSSGGAVEVFVLGDPERYSETARVHFEMLRKSGALIVIQADPEKIAAGIAAADVIVDGICGTGITRDIDGVYREIVERINDSGKPVVAIDIPSGVDGNNGAVRGVAVRAERTVTFGLPKRGNLIYPGAAMGGRLTLTHISFPPQMHEAKEIAVMLNQPPALPPRRVDGHKGSYGDVLFVAGAAGYFGAPAFAALSLLRAGAGYARLAAPRSIIPTLAAIAPEAVFVPQDETPTGSLAAKALEPLLELSGQVDLVVLGPGLSLADKTQHLVRKLTSRIEKPLLIDGDGLTAVAEDPDVVRYRAGATILTPHPGEMSRLLGQPVSEILADPVPAVQRAVEDLGAILVLKGPHSLIGLPDGTVHINTSGNSGMASAGSGDVLAGTIAAMHGLGLSVEDAVRSGVFVHGLAGDLAAEEQGEDGVIARDLVEQLPSAVRLFRDEYETVTANHYDTLERI